MPSSLLLRLKRVWTSATARMLSWVPRRNTPIINRTIAQTMSSVTSAVVSEPIEKLPMKCSGMWISANGTAVRSAAVASPWRCSSRVCTTPDHAVSSHMLMSTRFTSSPAS